MNPESKKRLFELFAAHAADSLTPEEHALLQETLRHDAEARRLWFVHQDVELGLHAHLPAESLVLPNVSAKPNRWLSWRPLAAAAAVLVLFVGSWLLLERGKKDGFIARVIRIDGELRTQSGRRFSVGDRLAAGETLTMIAGQAELAFF